MKSIGKIAICTLLLWVMVSCGKATHITGSWKKPGVTISPFRSVFVSALTTNIPAKSAVENGIQQMLEPRIKVYKSIDAFPPNFESTNIKDASAMLTRIRTTAADVIMTIGLVDKETEERYVPGSAAYNPMMFNYYGMYSLYWGYRAPMFYNPGYYVKDKIYYLETNIYDSKSENLIWSAQSKTYNPTDINKFLKGYLKSLEKQMEADGLIAKR